MTSSLLRLQIACGLILSGCLTGCSTSSFLKTSGDILQAPVRLVTGRNSTQSVSKILCLWESAQGQGLDGKPSRGFAGQLMFFEHGNPSPVKVDGQVVIYQYKDYDPDDEDHHLIHTFRFDSAAWQVHRAEGTLGHTYNVFLPFVEKHKDRVNCALRVEIVLPSGRTVSSPYTEVTLAGKKNGSQGTQRQPFVTNRQIGGKIEPVPQTADEALNTLTIEMPKKR